MSIKTRLLKLETVAPKETPVRSVVSFNSDKDPGGLLAQAEATRRGERIGLLVSYCKTIKVWEASAINNATP